MEIITDYKELKPENIVKLTMKNYDNIHEQYIGFYCTFLEKNKSQKEDQLLIGSELTAQQSTSNLQFVNVSEIEQICRLEEKR